MENDNNNFQPDSIVQTIINNFVERAKMGEEKYQTNLDRTDLEIIDWINHAIHEQMDNILYLEKLKQTIQKQEEDRVF